MILSTFAFLYMSVITLKSKCQVIVKKITVAEAEPRTNGTRGCNANLKNATQATHNIC